MSANDIDKYLQKIPARQRIVLERLRATVLATVPGVEECISYRVPAFRVAGGVVCGFASFKNHMSYLPFSGSVLERLSDQIDQYSHSKSALRFTSDSPLSDDLVRQLIAVRLDEITSRRR